MNVLYHPVPAFTIMHCPSPDSVLAVTGLSGEVELLLQNGHQFPKVAGDVVAGNAKVLIAGGVRDGERFVEQNIGG